MEEKPGGGRLEKTAAGLGVRGEEEEERAGEEECEGVTADEQEEGLEMGD